VIYLSRRVLDCKYIAAVGDDFQNCTIEFKAGRELIPV
jgi:hypothetical protein